MIWYGSGKMKRWEIFLFSWEEKLENRKYYFHDPYYIIFEQIISYEKKKREKRVRVRKIKTKSLT